MKNPGELTPTNENGEWEGWEWGVLIQDGPDVYFEIVTMYNSADAKTYDVLLTGNNSLHYHKSNSVYYEISGLYTLIVFLLLNILAELWTHRIMLYYVEQKDGAWLVPENIGQTVIETVPGQPFEVNFQDLNVDGKIFFALKLL